MPNRQLTNVQTDEPCPLVQGFKWLFSYATGRRVLRFGIGQARRIGTRVGHRARHRAGARRTDLGGERRG